MKPKVSLILPSLNAIKYLPACVESVKAQQFQDWEAIVLDSFSNDGTWEYWQRTAQEDARFKIKQVAKEGLYKALNDGFDLAQGELIGVVTCDDAMHPQFLSKTVQALEQCPQAGLAVTDLVFIDGEGKKIEDFPYATDYVITANKGEQMKQVNLRPVPHDFLLMLAGYTIYYSLTQVLVRKAVLKSEHRFHEKDGSTADYIWSLKLSASQATVHIPEPLATWRYHGDQLSCQKTSINSEVLHGSVCFNILNDPFFNHSLSSLERLALKLSASQMILNDQSRTLFQKIIFGFKLVLTLIILFVEKPLSTLQALLKISLKSQSLKKSWIQLLVCRRKIKPESIFL